MLHQITEMKQGFQEILKKEKDTLLNQSQLLLPGIIAKEREQEMTPMMIMNNVGREYELEKDTPLEGEQ